MREKGQQVCDECELLRTRMAHESHVEWVNAHGWKLTTTALPPVRLAVARMLVARALRLAPTMPLPVSSMSNRPAIG